MTLRWNKSQDPDGDAVIYDLYYCTDPDFTGCDSVNVALNSRFSVMYAGIVNFNGILLALGIGFTGFFKRRWKIFLLMAMIVIAGVVLTSCGGSSGNTPADQVTQEMTYNATGLSAGTTYYWKVVADDGKGGTAESGVWSFITR